MKRFLIFLLILSALLCGCQTEPAPLPPANFTGTVEGYTYYHENERDKKWEEDIITLGEAFLTNHPWLVNEETRVRCADHYPEEAITLWWKNHYDQEKYDRFLTEINALIPMIPKLNDTALPYEMHRIVASLEDLHSNVHIKRGLTFPIAFYPFREDDATVIRAVAIPAENEELLYTSLTSINGVPVEKVLEKMQSYMFRETDAYFMYMAVENGFGAGLNNRDLLEVIGVLKEGEAQADFTFQAENGESFTKKFTAVDKEDRQNMKILDHRMKFQHSFTWQDQGNKPYWFTYLEEEDVLYVRIFAFHEDPELPFADMCAQITNLFSNRGNIGKIIVDLRSNQGGYLLEGYRRFFQLLNHKQAGNVYALVDGGSVSMAAVCIYNIQNAVDDSYIVGMPAAQSVPFCAYYEDTYPELPNCGLTYGVSKIQTVSQMEGYTASNMPDILIYPTLEDYKNGVDTVLEYVLNMD